ncbi:hypothetical protein Bca4012_055989 [Brassica carinata]
MLSSIGEIPIIQVPPSINCIETTMEAFLGLGKTIQTIAFLAGVYGKDSDAGTDTSVSDTDLHIFRGIPAESNNIVLMLLRLCS